MVEEIMNKHTKTIIISKRLNTEIWPQQNTESVSWNLQSTDRINHRCLRHIQKQTHHANGQDTQHSIGIGIPNCWVWCGFFFVKTHIFVVKNCSCSKIYMKNSRLKPGLAVLKVTIKWDWFYLILRYLANYYTLGSKEKMVLAKEQTSKWRKESGHV